MPLPEGYLPRRGDVLLAPVTVTIDVDHGDKNVHVKAGGYGRTSIELKDIAGLVSCHFEIDDEVQSIRENDGFIDANGKRFKSGKIIAIHGAYAWVLYGDLLLTCKTDSLKPAQEPAKQEPPEVPAAPANVTADRLTADDGPLPKLPTLTQF